MSRVFPVLACGVIAFAPAGCRKDTGKAGTGTPASPGKVARNLGPNADKTPDFTLTSEQLSREMRTDKKGAVDRYAGKVIQVAGVVHQYLRDTRDVMLCMDVPGKFLDIHCFTTDPAPWDTAAPGQTVTIKGTFPHEFIVPTLKDCVIVAVEGPDITTMAAGDLVRKYEADPKEVLETYQYACLIISGGVAEKKELDGEVRVTFETGSMLKVVAVFRAGWDARDARRLVVGQPGQVVGNFNRVDVGRGGIVLEACLTADPSK